MNNHKKKGGKKGKKTTPVIVAPVVTGKGKFSMKKLVKGAGSVLGPIAKEVAVKAATTALLGVGSYRPKNQRARLGLTLGKIRGSGSYITGDEDEQNSLFSSGANAHMVLKSEVHENEIGGVTLTNEEYIQPIYCSATNPTAFQIETINVNPGLCNTLKVLSQLAGNFQQYRFIQLIFKFKPQISEFNATNGQVGMVHMAANYNVNDPPYQDTMTMNSSPGALLFKASKAALFGIECDPQKLGHTNKLYVRRYNLAPAVSSYDYKLYDHCNFYVAISDCPASYAGYCLGHLYCQYKIELILPMMRSLIGSTILCDRFYTTYQTTAATGYNPFGTSSSLIGKWQGNNIGGILTVSAGTVTYTFPPDATGAYKWTFCIIPNAAVAGADIKFNSYVVSGNVTRQNWLGSNIAWQASPSAADYNYGSTIGVGAGSTANTGLVCTGYVYVSQASGSLPNSMQWLTNAGCTSSVKASFELSQTNQFDYPATTTFYPTIYTDGGTISTLGSTN